MNYFLGMGLDRGHNSTKKRKKALIGLTLVGVAMIVKMTKKILLYIDEYL